PPKVNGLRENIQINKTLEDGSIQGLNSWPKNGYGGPCPPSGTHRYYFKLYALDIKLNLNSEATKENLLEAIEGHILAESQLMGKYLRK
ncbi:MAG: YbhB/YbcL family Raf kinase inhibitor-like protein, partial [Ignavibacteriales bacterium]|nr:YbhB/YbcL family Raf kinase inhibitor-like protein [Ignavibacteriales bacterium]